MYDERTRQRSSIFKEKKYIGPKKKGKRKLDAYAGEGLAQEWKCEISVIFGAYLLMITGDWIEKIGGFTREQMGKSDDESRKGYCKMSGKPLRMKEGEI